MTPLGIGRAVIGADGKKIKRCLRRGKTGRRHVLSVIRDGYVHTYHATKGWRVNKE